MEERTLADVNICRDLESSPSAGSTFFHPAAALRAPAMMEALRGAFLKLPKIVEACKNYVPPKRSREVSH